MVIKKLQNGYTTPEQSKRLLELGVPANSADCIRVTRTDMVFFTPEEKNAVDYIETYNTERNEKAEPCWTVGRLIEITTICREWFEGQKYHSYIFQRDVSPLEKAIEKIEMAARTNQLDFSKLEE